MTMLLPKGVDPEREPPRWQRDITRPPAIREAIETVARVYVRTEFDCFCRITKIEARALLDEVARQLGDQPVRAIGLRASISPSNVLYLSRAT